MNNRFHTPFLLLVTLLSPLACFSCSCDAGAPVPPVAPVATSPKVVLQPTAERALARSQERWNLVMKADWVAAYDFQTPEVKKSMPLGKYLGSVQMHKYENAKALEVLAVEKDHAYVRISTLWTPQHPNMAHVKLEPGESLTQEVVMIETWRWVDGDWSFQYPPKRDDEFFKDHPELLKKAPEPK
jgi:hypothetical protein